jgi:uncharacterized membrane protein SpoIIM required for sporulation
MLESVLKFREIEKSPYLTFVWALMIASVGILLSTQLSYKINAGGTIVDLTGVFAVLFTIIPSVYFLTMIIKKEEKMEQDALEKHYRKGFWERHERDLMFFLFYFLGVMFAFSIWAFILPADMFQIQLSKIYEIRSAVTGAAITKGSLDSFLSILTNNLEVLVFSFVFSLLFGAGAVFIIVWNASVLGVYIGELSKSVFEIPIVTLQFLPHGIPEVVGYLAAGLSGGLLSAAILRSHRKDVLLKIAFDSLKIMFVGAMFIILAAAIEVYL